MAKINKQKILRDLQVDLTAAEIVKKQWDTQREEWVNESYGNPYGNEVDGKSQIVSKDIRKQIEWLIPSATDPFLSTPDIVKCNPVTFEDVDSARQSELLLNTQFCRKFGRYNFVNKAVRVLATEGTVVVQTGWDYEEEVVEEEVEVVAVDEYGNQYITTEMQEVTKVVKNQPTATVCRNEDIYLDPTCMDDMDKCQFIIHRYETDMSTLKADGRYKNLDKITDAETRGDHTYVPEDETRFNFDDKPRRKMVVYEYWGNYDIDGDGLVEPIVCAWVGNVIIRLEDNPYPDQKPPFVIVPFNAVPFQMFGEALAANIGDNQKVKTAITRGIIDNMAQSNNGQLGMRRGALDMNNRKKFLQGKNFEYNGTPNDFWQGSYNALPNSVFNMMDLMNNEIEAQTGVKSFSGGITGNALGSTATAARGAMDATSVRRMHLVRNIAENMMKPLMRKWLAYDSEFLEEEEVIRITNEEYVPIRRDDLGGKLDIDITISTMEDNAAKADQLSFMLQTMGQSMDQDMQLDLVADWAELTRMPESAKRLRDKAEIARQNAGKPSPAEQLEMQRLELENKKLEAEIADLMSRAGENKIDAQLKINKARVEEAKARALNSKADLDDLSQIRIDHGFKHMEDMERDELKLQYQADMKERDRLANMQAMMFQANNKDKNIGVIS